MSKKLLFAACAVLFAASVTADIVVPTKMVKLSQMANAPVLLETGESAHTTIATTAMMEAAVNNDALFESAEIVENPDAAIANDLTAMPMSEAHDSHYSPDDILSHSTVQKARLLDESQWTEDTAVSYK